MSEYLLHGFTGSELVFYRDSFRKLFPHASFRVGGRDDAMNGAAGGRGAESDADGIVVNCRAGCAQSVAALGDDGAQGRPCVLFSVEKPEMHFLLMAQTEAERNGWRCMMLLSPASQAEIAECAEAIASGSMSYMTRAAMDYCGACGFGREFRWEDLTYIERTILWGMAAGITGKETADSLGITLFAVHKHQELLRRKYPMLAAPETLRAFMSWLDAQ